MSYFCAILTGRQQAGIGQGFEHLFYSGTFIVLGQQFGQGSAAAGVLGAFAQLRQPQKDAAGYFLLVGGQSLVGIFGCFGNRSLYATCFGVTRQRQAIFGWVAALPRF